MSEKLRHSKGPYNMFRGGKERYLEHFSDTDEHTYGVGMSYFCAYSLFMPVYALL